jgi:5-methylcytosine-specific restriction endonuclease McrA
MRPPSISTVREHIAWSYANLARSHAALEGGVDKYGWVHHAIRQKLYTGLTTRRMSMGSLYDDERIKLTARQACYYCGSVDHLVVDHLIPRVKGGPDEADNLIWACRACNSSKQGKDMLAWMKIKAVFPPLLLLRRYTKIVARFCENHGHMEEDVARGPALQLPFDLGLLPTRFPPLSTLRLWVDSAPGAVDSAAGPRNAEC